jgi:hypothetical protein
MSTSTAHEGAILRIQFPDSAVASGPLTSSGATGTTVAPSVNPGGRIVSAHTENPGCGRAAPRVHETGHLTYLGVPSR